MRRLTLALTLALGCGGGPPPRCPSLSGSAFCCVSEAFQERCVDGHRSRCEPLVRGVDENDDPAFYAYLWNYVGECR